MAMAASETLLPDDWNRVQSLAASKRWVEAYDILDGYIENALPPDAVALKAHLRAQLESLFERRFASEGVVRQSVPADQLRRHALRAKHAYLWTLCGNGLTVTDLIALSPLHPADSLRGLVMLVELGLVEEVS